MINLLRNPTRRLTLQLQLTLLYAGLFAGLCAAVLAATNVVVLRGPTPAGADVHRLNIASAAIFFPVAVIASLVLGWAVAGRLLRPLRAITATARDISATNLRRRLNVGGPENELKHLGITLDDLFGRLEESFDSQRHFVANAAHELRTPLAGQRTLLQVALADPNANAETLRSTCEEALELGTQQERLIDGLLTLASSEGGVERWEHFDLGDVARRILADRQDHASRRGIDVDAELSPAPVVGDPRLVASLVANLIDNALRHNVAGGNVAISTTSAAGRASISVSNTGPLIAPHAVDRLFQPFRQSGTERVRHADGHGLGLPIVQAIASAHRATVSARPRPDGGLDIQVSFPSSTE